MQTKAHKKAFAFPLGLDYGIDTIRNTIHSRAKRQRIKAIDVPVNRRHRLSDDIADIRIYTARPQLMATRIAAASLHAMYRVGQSIPARRLQKLLYFLEGALKVILLSPALRNQFSFIPACVD